MPWQLEELELVASLVQKEEQDNEQGNSQESSDPHEFEETDGSTETDEDEGDVDEDEDEDEDGDDETGDKDEIGDDDDDDTNDKDDDCVVDDGRGGHDENAEGIIAKADFSTDSIERNSLLGNNNDKEMNL